MNDEAFENDVASRIDLDSISQLIPRSKDGDAGAQAELLQHMQGYLEMMAARYMDKSIQQKVGPSDVVQQSLTKVVENFDQFRGATAAEFRGWLKTIVVNEMGKMRRIFRAAKRDIALERHIEPPNSGTNFVPNSPSDKNLTPSSEAIASEQVENFYEILDQLPDDYAQIIRLRSIERLPFKEITDRMERSHDSVTKLWYRAVLKFEELLRESGNFESKIDQ